MKHLKFLNDYDTVFGDVGDVGNVPTIENHDYVDIYNNIEK
jgi:hypothetical protein